jgi:hypothetical protein
MAGTKNVPAKQPEGGAVAAYDYGEYAGMGMDKVGKDELLIPFLAILQPMSPIVTEGDNDNAKPGRYYNTITGDLYDGEKEGVPFQLVDFERMFVEWIPRDSGGGIAGRYQPDDPFVLEEIQKNKGSVVGIKLANGNDLVETYYAYGNILSQDLSQVESFAVLPLKSTNIKPFRTLLTALRMIKGKPPLFAFKVMLKCTKEKNDSGVWYQFMAKPTGTDWRGSMIDPGGERHLLEAATGLIEMVRSGAAKADYANEGKATGGSGGGSGDGDDDVPF